MAQQMRMGPHHVGFVMPNQLPEESPSIEKSETDSRQQNSRREFKIRQTSNSNSKRRGGKKGNKSPSELTNIGGKSVISMFTSNSGKTTFSAPVNNGMEDSASAAGDNDTGNNSPLHKNGEGGRLFL